MKTAGSCELTAFWFWTSSATRKTLVANFLLKSQQLPFKKFFVSFCFLINCLIVSFSHPISFLRLFIFTYFLPHSLIWFPLLSPLLWTSLGFLQYNVIFISLVFFWIYYISSHFILPRIYDILFILSIHFLCHLVLVTKMSCFMEEVPSNC